MQSHKILRIPSFNTHLQNTLSRNLKVSKILSQILINRGINTSSEAQAFLNLNLNDLLDPFMFKDMHKAVGRIGEAIRKKEKVLIFGDYDVDGITSVVILKEIFLKAGMDVIHYIPHRIKEGYGLTRTILQTVKKENIKLLITVDCGTSNREEIEELSRHGVDTIITDHHEPQGKDIPKAYSIINPKIKESNYNFRELAGVGVAYKLAQAFTGKSLEAELDLVTLGTIADVVPLIGENRIIAKEGLKVLAKTKRPGIRALIDSSRIGNRKFNSTFVGFILGPRLNASGRMSTAETSLNLLMSHNLIQAKELALLLEQHNRNRQKIEAKIMQEAEDLINKEINFKDHKVIVVAKEDWHQGVLGIVASKLADRFYRPTIVISLDENLCKGSGRSIKNFHLFHALKECRQFLHAFGGHAHAAGLLITRNSIEDFKNSINRFAHDKLTFEDLLPSLDVDMEVNLSDLTETVVQELERLEPFGTGNPEPLFFTRTLKLKSEPQFLSRETLKFWVSDGVTNMQAIGFGMSSLGDNLLQAKSFDLVYTPRIDNWQLDTSIILEVKDIFFK